MHKSIVLLTLAAGTLFSQGTYAGYGNNSKSADSSKKCGWNFSTNVRGGFFYSSLAYRFPEINSESAASFGISSTLASGPKVSLEQTVGFKDLFKFSLSGSFSDLYIASPTGNLSIPRGYIADTDGRFFVPFTINQASKMHLSIMAGFGWQQTYIKPKVPAGVDTDDATIAKVKARYLFPIAGLFLDFCPSKKSYVNFGLSVFFPKVRLKNTSGANTTLVPAYLRIRRHGWKAEYEYRYKLSYCTALLARMEYKELNAFGGLLSSGSGQIRPYAIERIVSGSLGVSFSY
jgi:hypothetical protein